MTDTARYKVAVYIQTETENGSRKANMFTSFLVCRFVNIPIPRVINGILKSTTSLR